MSKKSKRRKAQKSISAKQSGAFFQKSEKPAVAPSVTQTQQHAVKDVAGIQESQYKYIMPEVIRICIISGVIFAAIVALSYFIK